MVDMTLQMVMKLKDEATKELKKAGEAASGLNKTALMLGGAAVVGTLALAASLWDCAKAAGEEEVGVGRLKTAVENSGGAWSTAQGAIESYLTAELKRVALDDGEGRDSIARLTTATGDYKSALALMPGVLDLAAGAFKGNMEPATKAVMLALNGNVASLNKLGLELPKTATQVEIMAAIQEKFGGQAEAYGNTFEGSQKKMSIAMGNLKETIGAAVLPALTGFITTLSTLAMEAMPYVEKAVGYLSSAIGTAFPIIQGVIQAALGVVIPILDGFFAFLQDPGAAMFAKLQLIVETVMPIIQSAISGALAAITAFWTEHGEAIMGTVSRVFATIQSVIETVIGIIQTTITTALAAIQVFWTEHGTQVQLIVSTAFDAIKGYIETVMGIVRGIIAAVTLAIHGDWSGAWETIKTTMSTAWEGIKGVVSNAIDAVKGVLALAWSVIGGTVTTAWEGIKKTISGKVDEIWTKVSGTIGWLQTWLGTTMAGIQTAITKPFTDAYASIAGSIDSIWTKVSGTISWIGTWLGTMKASIAGAFTNIFSGIHIPMPHFTWDGGDILRGVMPSFGVSWYGAGGDFVANAPTLIGVGEAGAERVQITPLGGGRGGGVGGMSLTFVYAPVMSLASEREAYEKIAPVIREVLRRENRR
jgi:hypothetical protein